MRSNAATVVNPGKRLRASLAVPAAALAAVAFLPVQTPVCAGPPRRGRAPARFRRVDRNRDGRIEPAERRAAARKRFEKSRVDEPWEVKADRNHDGIVGPAERQKAGAAKYLDTRSAVDRPWEVRADRNGDGKVDAVELRAWHRSVLDANHDGRIDATERHRFWLGKKARVDTPWERRHDVDGNGIITGDEARKMLHDRYIMVKTHGKAKVDSEIEAQFDANHDGLIDGKEADAVLDALGETETTTAAD